MISTSDAESDGSVSEGDSAVDPEHSIEAVTHLTNTAFYIRALPGRG